MLNPPVRDINYFAYSGQILIFFFFGGGRGLLVCNVSTFVLVHLSPSHEENSWRNINIAYREVEEQWLVLKTDKDSSVLFYFLYAV